MKKVIVRFLMCFLFVSTIILTSSNNFVEASGIQLLVNKEEIKFKENFGSPYLDSKNRIMIPLRTISEELGHKVEWIEEIKTIAIDNNIYISIADDNIYTIIEDGDIFIKSLGKMITMDTEAQLKNNKTYVPVRFIVEALGHKLEYENNKGNNKINILKNQGTVGNTTTQGKESYSGYIKDIDVKNNQIIFKKQEMLSEGDIKIFPELNLDEDDFPGGFYIVDIDNIQTFKLTDSTKYNMIVDNNILGEDVQKYKLLDAFSKSTMYSGFFIIEAKDNSIISIREIYHP